MLVVFSLRLRRTFIGIGLSAAASVSLSGCTTPMEVSAPAVSGAPLAAAWSAGDAVPAQEAGSDTTVAVVQIDPSSTNRYAIGGGHSLWVRANGVCELDSPYGAAFWDTPCALRQAPFTMTVRSWRNAAGHPQVEFSPDVRFAATWGLRGTAMLFLHDTVATPADQPTILYCRDGECVDESITDPSLVTIVDVRQGYVYRRVKHLSGFVIAGGFAE